MVREREDRQPESGREQRKATFERRSKKQEKEMLHCKLVFHSIVAGSGIVASEPCLHTPTTLEEYLDALEQGCRR